MPRKRANEHSSPSPVTHTFVVKRSDELLNFLLARFEGKLSRNSVKSLLSDHKVLVNGSMTSQFNYPLAKDDEVKISKTPVRTAPVRKEAGQKSSPDASLKPYIIYEDEEFLAIDKPAGLLSVESDKSRKSAYALAVDYLKKNGAQARPYIIHRIDKETSGVLVFAKDIRIQSMMKMNWNDYVTLREYYAVVSGVMEEKKKEVVSYLMENTNHHVFVTRNPKGKKAVTRYEVIRENESMSLLRVEIDTGKKNQIRAQMDFLGHPILGDDKYANLPSPIQRLCLHASTLCFTHPVTKKPMRFHAPVPKEFTKLF